MIMIPICWVTNAALHPDNGDNFKKKFGSYTNSGSVGPPPPTTPMVPKRVMWFINNTPMHHIGALSDQVITYRLARFLPSKIYASLRAQAQRVMSVSTH